MPLQKGKSREVVQANIKELIDAGHSPAQAEAIAYKTAGMDEAETARLFDDYGWMTIEGNPISKVGVFPYLGKQIGAPEPDQIYMVYRPAEELSDPATIESFKLTPFINEHPTALLGNEQGQVPTDQKRIEGVIGEQVYFEYPYLKANVRVYSAQTLDSIDLGKEEVSAGYQCRWSPENGVFEGQSYQYVQRTIRGNHSALVGEGRSGPDVAIMDSAMDSMTFTLDSKELRMAEETKAAEGEMTLSDVVAMLKQIGPQIKELMDAHAAMKSGAEDDASTEENEGEEAMDEEEKREEQEKEGKKIDAMDAQIKALKSELAALKSNAMDSGKLLADIANAKDLANRVSQHIGSFAHDAMDLNAVAAYACDKVGLKAAKGSEVTAIEAWLHGRPVNHAAVTFAQDSGANSGAAFLKEQYK